MPFSRKDFLKAIYGLGIIIMAVVILFLGILTGCTSSQVEEVGEILEGEGKLIEQAVEASQSIGRPSVHI